MLICGIKVSHDSAVAVIDGQRLLFSIEMEKLANNPRYSSLGQVERISEILRMEGLEPKVIDQFVLDGWLPESGGDRPGVSCNAGGRRVALELAPYLDSDRPSLTRYPFSGPAGRHSFPYVSYHHATGHILSCYCTSPFAQRAENSLILVWDGSMSPRLYLVAAKERTVSLIAQLMPLTGNIFGEFSGHFSEFQTDDDGWDKERRLRYDLAIAGKAMAYSALGRTEEELFGYFDSFIDCISEVSTKDAGVLTRRLIKDRETRFADLSDADLIATLQAYLGQALVTELGRVVHRLFPGQEPNLGMAGGCALNIKWNSLIRSSGYFRDVWVPPFPNDSGAAIGTATAEMFVSGKLSGKLSSLSWDLFSGPRLGKTPPQGWLTRPCSEKGVAELLHSDGEPVVFLSGRAELGPRALGNRSILAPATSREMKDQLNRLKGRAGYRPIAPVCLEHRAPDIFDPGTADPHMLFEHKVRLGWASRIPAVVHLDNTARLQTVDATSTAIGRVLSEYEKLTGIPVLCNTSANFNGCGFFPDLESAAKWGRIPRIWCDGTLYIDPAIVT